MRFWDSSALVALHVQQASTTALRALYAEDLDVLVWTMSDVEMRSAVCRLHREGAMSPEAFQEAIVRIESFWDTVHIVSLVDSAKLRAKRLLGTHSLRAADALQLGAALAAAYDEPLDEQFVCLDGRLSLAARLEGFTVLP